ncbi:uncharacterized protein LOC120255255 [Dioscorea cayenensis subsp. rotundata]|uniref:Uncharacterized protein LOC120255255 n=1 Tax=Dioscorea cayennensis subsp. rotundata TaxID=55577 RepID=A0AB40AW36_DIOCR|nr:uncharacterized protein LOC120255255 [Dioscorea cayenensis subsp. rotundata]
MASGDRQLAFPAPGKPKSWAQIASGLCRSSDNSPLHNEQILAKLKVTTTDFIRLDSDAINRARMKFQHALYGKLFGKTPNFDQVKSELLAKWSSFGKVSISYLPNGFLLIRCPSQACMQRILLDGPWSVNGIILQLSPWKPYFEPTFPSSAPLLSGCNSTTFPLSFGGIDEFTNSLSRSKYARICVEIDLSKPLSRGFWIGDDLHRVFVVVQYERLPTFCYMCGMIGHGSNSCP